jgi:hypothetical protein
MNKPGLFYRILIALLVFTATSLNAQEEEKSSNFETGADIFSSYVWRGSKLAGPSFQPSVSFSAGGLTLGVWGSFDSQGYAEADPYISWSFPFGLSMGLTDYYFCDQRLFDVSDSIGSHALDLNLGFETGGLSLSANYIINEAGGAGSTGGDMYFEAGYDFGNFNIFLGAGDGWHTEEGDFQICNIGIGTAKEIKITDTFSLPVSGQVVMNPDREQLFVVVGFSL